MPSSAVATSRLGAIPASKPRDRAWLIAPDSLDRHLLVQHHLQAAVPGFGQEGGLVECPRGQGTLRMRGIAEALGATETRPDFSHTNHPRGASDRYCEVRRIK